MTKGGRISLLTASTCWLMFYVVGAPAAVAASADLSHAFHAVGAIPSGSLVSLDPVKAGTVEVANTTNQAKLTGIAVSVNDSLLAVDSTNGTVQVATSGNARTLVSTLDGDINVGDKVAASPFNGVGMLSVPGSHVVGLAETAFNANSPGATKQSVRNLQGKTSQIWVGYAEVSIAIGTDNSSLQSGQNLNSLQKIAKNLTGHNVSTLRVLASLIVTSASVVALVTLVYASIYGSIISVGRNPLAKLAIFNTLGRVLLMAVLVATLSALVIFLLLR